MKADTVKYSRNCWKLKYSIESTKVKIYKTYTYAGHGTEWKMEWNGTKTYVVMEYGRCQNGMKGKISRMEWKTIFHTSISISN